MQKKRWIETKDLDIILIEYKKYLKDFEKTVMRNKTEFFKKKTRAIEYSENALIFDVDEKNNTFFYIVSSKSTNTDCLFKINKFQIDDDGIINLNNGDKYLYNTDIEKYFEDYDTEHVMHDYHYKEKQKTFFDITISNIYEDNLFKLNSSKYYKYLNFDKIINYINNKKYIIGEDNYENKLYTLENLLFFPVKFKSFEYLVKFGFYELALSYSWMFEQLMSLTRIFIENKDKLNDNLKANITFEKFMTYKLCSFDEDKMNSLRFWNFDFDDRHCLSKSESYLYLILCMSINVNIDNYLVKLIKDRNTIEEYFNYIGLCKRRGIDLNIKDNLMPDYFEESYYMLSIQTDEFSDKEDKIKDIGEIANLINVYENDKYIIFACPSAKSLLEESRMMHNCVRNYYKSVARGDCQIYFMREKKDINSSLVTIEVRDRKVVQAYQKYNKPCTLEQNEFIKEFEENLAVIVVDNN